MKTLLGARLRELRQEIIASGSKLLGWDELYLDSLEEETMLDKLLNHKITVYLINGGLVRGTLYSHSGTWLLLKDPNTNHETYINYAHVTSIYESR